MIKNLIISLIFGITAICAILYFVEANRMILLTVIYPATMILGLLLVAYIEHQTNN